VVYEALKHLALGARLPEDLRELQESLNSGRIIIASNGMAMEAMSIIAGLLNGSVTRRTSSRICLTLTKRSKLPPSV